MNASSPGQGVNRTGGSSLLACWPCSDDHGQRWLAAGRLCVGRSSFWPLIATNDQLARYSESDEKQYPSVTVGTRGYVGVLSGFNKGEVVGVPAVHDRLLRCAVSFTIVQLVGERSRVNVAHPLMAFLHRQDREFH